MDDEMARILLLVLLLAAALAAALGGVLFPIAGVWRDGASRIVLRQRLFRIRGEARQADGAQLYVGFMLFGYTRLARHDFGIRHLMRMGFSAPQAKELEGARTGFFVMRRLGEDVLDGTFAGTHFTFGSRGARDAGPSEARPRRWVREGSPAHRALEADAAVAADVQAQGHPP